MAWKCVGADHGGTHYVCYSWRTFFVPVDRLLKLFLNWYLFLLEIALVSDLSSVMSTRSNSWLLKSWWNQDRQDDKYRMNSLFLVFSSKSVIEKCLKLLRSIFFSWDGKRTRRMCFRFFFPSQFSVMFSFTCHLWSVGMCYKGCIYGNLQGNS